MSHSNTPLCGSLTVAIHGGQKMQQQVGGQYVILTAGQAQRCKTDAVKAHQDPVWEQTHTFFLEGAEKSFHADVWTDRGQHVGQLDMYLTSLDMSGKPRWYQLKCPTSFSQTAGEISLSVSFGGTDLKYAGGTLAHTTDVARSRGLVTPNPTWPIVSDGPSIHRASPNQQSTAMTHISKSMHQPQQQQQQYAPQQQQYAPQQQQVYPQQLQPQQGALIGNSMGMMQQQQFIQQQQPMMVVQQPTTMGQSANIMQQQQQQPHQVISSGMMAGNSMGMMQPQQQQPQATTVFIQQQPQQLSQQQPQAQVIVRLVGDSNTHVHGNGVVCNDPHNNNQHHQQQPQQVGMMVGSMGMMQQHQQPQSHAHGHPTLNGVPIVVTHNIHGNMAGQFEGTEAHHHPNNMHTINGNNNHGAMHVQQQVAYPMMMMNGQMNTPHIQSHHVQHVYDPEIEARRLRDIQAAQGH